jgi:release factor glutamine methyltransferase
VSETTNTVRRVLGLAAEWLAKKGVDAPRLDAELLLAKVLGVRRLDLYLDHDRPLSESEVEPFRALLRRRGAREPLAYVVGERESFGLAFEVSRAVLIPRPETEELVALVRDELRELASAGRRELAFADVGTGSGCIAVALLARGTPEGASLRGFATDRSADALAVARRNAERHGVLERLELLEGDLLAPVRERLSGTGRLLELVVSNPPYVLPSERASLEPELSFEPEGALFDAGEDLPLTARLAHEARAVLAPGGLLTVETGAGRAALVRGHLERAGFVQVTSRKDLGGHERFVLGRAPEGTTT